MTTANKITIARILLIPIFVGFSIHYAESVKESHQVQHYRWAAIGVYLVAALSDGLDGFIARRYNQRSRLGAVLDPIADKALMISALLTMNKWPSGFPLWFVTLVVSREALLIAGALLLHYLVGDLRMRPHWIGKTSTFLLMVAIAWVMLQLPLPFGKVIMLATSIFVLASTAIYIADGIGQFQASGHGEAEPKSQ